MKIAVLGPGGVGGLIAGALARRSTDDPAAGPGPGIDRRAAALRGGVAEAGGGGPAETPTDRRSRRSSIGVVARQSTARTIETDGLRVSSVLLGDFTSHPRALTVLREPVQALIVATKARGLAAALERIEAQPALVLPLLNGLDHLNQLRERFGPEPVVAGTIRVEADRPEPAVVVHTSRFLRVDMASRYESQRAPMEWLAAVLSDAGIPARVFGAQGSGRAGGGSAAVPPKPAPDGGEAQVMWSKLVRLNALACTTSAYDLPLGPIRSTPELRADLLGAIEEGCAVARAEGAEIPPGDPLGELTAAHDALGSSMQRDIAAGREPELDAIPGAVLRAAARHGIACPTIERLVGQISARLER